jgi:hypothetical protein
MDIFKNCLESRGYAPKTVSDEEFKKVTNDLAAYSKERMKKEGEVVR